MNSDTETNMKKEDINADVNELLKQLNQKVYELYELTDEEIDIVEGN